jgi:RHS repeat-associated protein
VFGYNLRFPGQYRDRETGWHYNYFRDYEPGTGRYMQSDPMGLWGGLSTYAYVFSNPLDGVDPRGLIKHSTGQTIECAKNCTIRIDTVLDEKTGQVKRHLHWECRGDVGVAGENGGNSHGGNCDGMPNKVKECAKANGFNCDPLPPPPTESRMCDRECQQRVSGIMTTLGMMYMTYRVLCGGPY